MLQSELPCGIGGGVLEVSAAANHKEHNTHGKDSDTGGPLEERWREHK